MATPRKLEFLISAIRHIRRVYKQRRPQARPDHNPQSGAAAQGPGRHERTSPPRLAIDANELTHKDKHTECLFFFADQPLQKAEVLFVAVGREIEIAGN